MAEYKIVLTVKDRYGNIKEVDGGNVDINLEENDIENIVDNLKDNISVEVENKSPVYVPEVTADNMLKFTRTEGITEDELEFDIDKSNDWNEIDHTTGSSFIWEPMK